MVPSPYISVHVELPALQVSSDVEFLVDTGADGTTLLYDDIVDLGVPPRRVRSLPRTGSMAGVGGEVTCYTTRAIVSLQDDTRSEPYYFDIGIDLAPSVRTANLPSLLGRDVLNRVRCTLDYEDGEVTLVVK